MTNEVRCESPCGSIWSMCFRPSTAALVVGTALLLAVPAARPQEVEAARPVYSVLYTFTGGADGAYPGVGFSGTGAGLTRDKEGNLYGTTFNGGDETGNCGSSGCGVVFKLDAAGKETVLHAFTGPPDGYYPAAAMVRDEEGNLYGTTSFGGSASLPAGTVFKLDPAGKETVLYSFTGGADGNTPGAGVIRDEAGNLYGTTLAGGGSNCRSGVYGGPGRHRDRAVQLHRRRGREVSHVGIDQGKRREPLRHHFQGRRLRVRSGVQAGPDRQRDGASQLHWGRGRGAGLRTSGARCRRRFLWSCCRRRQFRRELRPFRLRGSVQAGRGREIHCAVHIHAAEQTGRAHTDAYFGPVGTLYGTTNSGGAVGGGVVFSLDAAGRETVLHDFTSLANGVFPYVGLVQDAAGNFYGTTGYGGNLADAVCGNGIGCGVVFKLKP